MIRTIYQCPRCGEEWSKPHCRKCADEREAHSSAPDCSLAHVHMQILTPNGNTAKILGNRHMPEKTINALAEMIDAAVKAANAGELKAPENEKGQR